MAGLRRLTGVAALLGLLLAAPAAGAMTQEEAKAAVAERYGVEVLKVEPGTVDGQPVWLVTVMQPGGDSNSAFRVTRLAVDRDSGELVPSFRHGDSSGYQVPPSGGRFTRDLKQPGRASGTVWR